MKPMFQSLNITYDNKKHFPAFDGIRGAGIIIVVLYHYLLLPYGAWFSMESFFVLSGFLITGILLDTKSSEHYFKNYLARRMLRILPLYYGFLITAFLIVPLFVSKEHLAPYQIYYDHQGYFWAYIQNWFLLKNEAGLKGTSRIMLHLWSLAIEEQFYIFWPFMVLFFRIKTFLRVIIGMILFSIALKCYFYFAGYSWQYNYFNSFTRFDSLCLGGLLAVLIREKIGISTLEKITPYIFKILGTVLLVSLILFRPKFLDSQFLEPVGSTLFAILFAAMILYCLSPHKKNYVKGFLELRLLTYLGKYSYSLYIFHVPFLALLRPYLTSTLQHYMKGGFAYLISSCITLTATYLFALFTWAVIEKPALKLKRFFKYDTKKPEPATFAEQVSIDGL